VEALGRATAARSQLEFSFNLIVAIVASEPAREYTCHPRESFGSKVEYLRSISRSQLLKHEWWQSLRRIAATAEDLDKQYSSAAMSGIYGRSGGSLEATMRALAEKMDLVPPSLNMTPARINGVARGFFELASATCDLATSLIQAAEKLSIWPHRN
jgi:hypothetical protein